MSFHYGDNNQHLYCGDHDLYQLARTQSQPFYVYDGDAIVAQAAGLRQALGRGILLYYAVKANPHPTILSLLKPHVDGLDISSAGELEVALQAGFTAEQCSFAGPGKTATEIEYSVKGGIGIVSVESLTELRRVNEVSRKLGVTTPVSLRINPVYTNAHFAIRMGGRPSQFGIDEEELPTAVRAFTQATNCALVGIHVYSGTQCLDAPSLAEAMQAPFALAERVMELSGTSLQYINVGGGFGIPYHAGQHALNTEQVVQALYSYWRAFQEKHGLKDSRVIVELGRYLVGEAGLYIAQVVDIKTSRGRVYVVLDGGLNHHLPASGNFGQVIRKNYKLMNLIERPSASIEEVTVVGPICTTLDVLADRMTMVKPELGNYVAIANSGAYGYSVSPLLFLSHPTPAEILLKGAEVHVIRPSRSISSFV